MSTSQFSKIKPLKKLPIEEFISEWQSFYSSYEIDAGRQNSTGVLPENVILSKKPEKTSFRKIKRSKTLDVNSFLSSVEGAYEEFGDTTVTQNDSIPLNVKVRFLDDQSKGENSMDFSSLDTAITPLRELKIDEHTSFSPFRIKESPKWIEKRNEPTRTALIKDLKNTQRRSDKDETNFIGNKETRKYSMRKGLLKKTATSSRILKFD